MLDAAALAIALAFGGPDYGLSSESAAFAGIPRTRRPARIETFWLGLLPHGPRAQVSSGIVVLRPPTEGRVRIAGGRFAMGSTPSEMQSAMELCRREPLGTKCGQVGDEAGPLVRAEGWAHDVTLAEFELDRTEVSVERYQRCVSASACTPPSFPAGDTRYDRPDFPVTHVRWDDAVAYCSWVGGRLPTEAEWEYAAQGRANHAFPWGDLYNPRLANHGMWAFDQSDARDGFIGLAPIGSFPDGATPTGLLDMAGNASEWVWDFYDRDDEGYGYGRGAQVNPKGPAFSPWGHAVRGGSYRNGSHEMRTAARRASSYAARDIGFRCAYTPS